MVIAGTKAKLPRDCPIVHLPIVDIMGAQIARWLSVIERLRVWVPAGAAEESSSAELTFCADSFFVCPIRCYHSGTLRPWSFWQKCRWQVTPKNAYTLDPAKLEWADYAIQEMCANLLGKQALMQLAREHSATVVSARWVTVDWSKPKERN